MATLRPTSVRPKVVFVLLTLVWGSSYFFTVIALESFESYVIVYLRIAIGTVLTGILVLGLRLKFPPWGRIYAHLLVLGLISIAMPFVLVTEAQVHVHSSMAAILISTSPLFVFLISWLWRREETLTVGRVFGLVFCFLGVFALYGLDGSAQLDSGGWPFVVLVVGFLFAVSNIYTRIFLDGTHPVVLAFLQLGAGLLVLTPFIFFFTTPFDAVPSVASVLAVLQLGAVSSGAAYVMLAYLIQVWGSTAASMNTYLQPIVGVALGALVLGDAMPFSAWLSVSVILLGIAVFGADAYVAGVRRTKARRRLYG